MGGGKLEQRTRGWNGVEPTGSDGPALEAVRAARVRVYRASTDRLRHANPTFGMCAVPAIPCLA